MAHLAKRLRMHFPAKVRLIEIPQGINSWKHKLQLFYFYGLAFYLKFILKKKDRVLFMEYLGNISGNQTGLALQLRKWKVTNPFYGLVHLSGNYLMEMYGSADYIRKGAEAVDRLVVLGSSLQAFFASLGFGEKTILGFHYVDDEYYKQKSKKPDMPLKVIHMGSIKRNFDQLKEIVKACPEIQFHICQGHNDLSAQFEGLNHVRLHGFMEEKELLELMQECDISLGVMDDTVGSNVITTSMACGLVNVVSDVGSVRDYCNDNNAVLCKSTADFVSALQKLGEDPEKINALKKNLGADVKRISLPAFYKWFEQHLLPTS